MKHLSVYILLSIFVGCGASSPHAVAGATLVVGACIDGESTTTLRNEGGSALVWDATVDVAGLSVDPHGTVSAGASIDIHVRTVAQAPGPALDGVLTIVTNDPDNGVLHIPVHVLRSGSHFSLDRTVFDFGILPVGVAAPLQGVVVKNDGNEAGTVKLDPGDGFAVDGTQLPQIAPGQSAPIKLTFKPTKTTLYVSGPTVSAGNHCGEPPIVALKGIGSEGVVGISPGIIDLGLLGCGAKPSTTQKLTVINASKQPFDVTAMLTTWQIFSVTPGIFTVNGESQQDIDVGVALVPSTAPIVKDWFKDTLTITTTAPKDTPHAVPIVGTPSGGVLVASPSIWDFGKRRVPDVATYDFAIDNYGNAPVTLALTTKDPFSVPSTVQVVPGLTAKMTVTHTGRGEDVGATVDEAIDWAATDPICAPLPPLAHAKVYTYEKATTAAPRNNNGSHSCAAGESGHAYCWGPDNSSGELGTLNVANNRPSLVATLTNVKGVGVGHHFSCAVEGNGVPWCWGGNYDGRLGDGTTTDRSTPVKVTGISDALSVATGLDFACALRKTGAVACWGRGSEGQLGDGNNTWNNVGWSATPVTVANLNDAIALDVRAELACAARAGGAVVCWGHDPWSSFGGAGVTTAFAPVVIAGVSGAKKVAVNQGACYLDANGAGACWGTLYNSTSTSPVSMPFQSGATSIAAGSLPSTFCVITPYFGPNAARCWGYNGGGELGNGISSMGSNAPVTALTPAEFVAIGDTLVMAIQKDGSLWQWGSPQGSPTKAALIPGFDP